MRYKECRYMGYTIHAYTDGSCTALGQYPFPCISEARRAIREREEMLCSKKKSLCELALLPPAVPFCIVDDCMGCDYPKQEGSTPMRYNDNYACATASVAAQQSDAAVTRDFLLKELASADCPKEQQLQKFYNLFVNNTPKTYKEMIEIIKAGTYTIDSKIAKRIEAAQGNEDYGDYCFGISEGIIWPGPVSDWDGYRAAQAEKAKQASAAKRTIMTSDAVTGLAAIQAFEAWMPTPATPQ